MPGGWSIAVEMNFYLLVPWFYQRIQNARRAATAAFLTLIACGLLSAAVKIALRRTFGTGAETHISLFTWHWWPTRIPVFLTGILLFFLLRPLLAGAPDASGVIRPDAGLLLAMSIYLIVALALSKTALFLGHGLFAVAFLLLAWSLAIRPHSWLVNRVTCDLGVISFSGCPSHFALLDRTVRGFQGLPLEALPPLIRLAALVAAALAGTVIVSTITCFLIGVPGQALGRRLISRLESSRAAPEPTSAVV